MMPTAVVAKHPRLGVPVTQRASTPARKPTTSQARMLMGTGG